MNPAKVVCLGVLAAVLALPARAHHGVAPHYDDGTQVTIDGTVAEFQFINPHSFVYLRIVGADGQEAIWHCEMASRSVLARNGLTQETFAAGKARQDHGQPGASEPDRLRGARGALRRRQRAARVHAVRRHTGDDRRPRGAARVDRRRLGHEAGSPYRVTPAC